MVSTPSGQPASQWATHSIYGEKIESELGPSMTTTHEQFMMGPDKPVINDCLELSITHWIYTPNLFQCDCG